jgi:uncharacterized protein YunC (DUF1805 family)
VSLFDAIREKASELLSGATEKVGDLAGDVPGVQDLSQSATDASEQVAGTAQDLGATATDLSGSVTDTVTGALPELPEPYRP